MRKWAFTLTEVVVVIAIILILAALAMTAYQSGRRKAGEADEASRLRQIYTALCLYEEDNDQKPPASLVDLAPTYLLSDYLANPRDARSPLRREDWPANPWVNSWVVDPPEVSNRRSKTMVSYVYLKTFEARFPSGQTWESLRQNSKVGVISGLGLMTCQPVNGSGCSYPVNKPEMDEGQPSPNLAGTILTVKMDGSISSRQRMGPSEGTMSLESLFFSSAEGKPGSQSADPG